MTSPAARALALNGAVEGSEKDVTKTHDRHEPSLKVAALDKPASLRQPFTYEKTRQVSADPRRFRDGKIIVDDADDSDRELRNAFRTVRAEVMKHLNAANQTTLGVVSSRPGEGKTTVTANLALSMTRYFERTVLLVDLDLTRPSVHEVFGIDVKSGLTDHFTRGVPLADCLVNPGLERLVLLPAGTVSRHSSELLGSTMMRNLFEELTARYPERIILFDLPPVLVSDDAISFLRNTGCCALFVMEAGTSRTAEAERAFELLEDCLVIGTVLNKVKKRDHKYYYGYGY